MSDGDIPIKMNGVVVGSFYISEDGVLKGSITSNAPMFRDHIKGLSLDRDLRSAEPIFHNVFTGDNIDEEDNC